MPDSLTGMNRFVSSRFAGRAKELAVLASAFDEAISGVSGIVLIGGEAGGGKSRLVREFAAAVGERARILQGNCIEQSEAGLPYTPFVAALRTLERELGVAEISALAGGGAGELAWLSPVFGDPDRHADRLMARARLFEVVLRLLERLAESRPLVLVVEDLHWADPSTRDLLGFLVANLGSAPVLLVITFRDDKGAYVNELGRMDRVTWLNLDRLSRREVAEQLHGILGRAPEAGEVNAVYQRCQRVPLFTEALVNPDGTVRTALPGSLRDLLLGVVNELPDPAQEVLRAAAVGGDPTQDAVGLGSVDVLQHAQGHHPVVRPAEVVGEHVESLDLLSALDLEVDERLGDVGAGDRDPLRLDEVGVPTRTGADFEHGRARLEQADQALERWAAFTGLWCDGFGIGAGGALVRLHGQSVVFHAPTLGLRRAGTHGAFS